jgi:hypothetical protein
MVADAVMIPATDPQGVLNSDAPAGALPAAVRRLDALRDTTRQHRRTSWTTDGCSLAGLCRMVQPVAQSRVGDRLEVLERRYGL